MPFRSCHLPALPAAIVTACLGMLPLRAQESPVPAPTSPAAAPAVPSPTPDSALPPQNSPPTTQSPTPSLPLLSPMAESPDWKTLTRWGSTMTRQDFEKAVASVYTDGSPKPPPWRIEGEVLFVETSAGTPPVSVPFAQADAPPAEPPRYWRTPSELAPLKPGEPPLKGLHIALDPGHIGGEYAQMEERWLSMTPGEAIMEGQLVLQVAHLLKPRLEALGAAVVLVRTEEKPVTIHRPQDLRPAARQVLHEAGLAQPAETYVPGQDDSRIATVQWQSEKLFYRVSEIRARAHRVNTEIKPDLVLCLHLNAEAWGDPKKPAFVPVNHLHLLVNGCYSPDELRYEDVRFEMLQRLLSRAHEQEIPLADALADSMAKATGLPAYTYLQSTARRVSGSSFVWARNLLANRLYQCPVIYFEPYVMNHEQTYKRLLLGHYIGRTLLDGQLVTSPLEDYVRGIVTGLTSYYTTARTQGGGG